jgi:hypothetical protein
MKYSLIKYRFANGSEQEWHAEIARFIAALDGDPALAGKISYRCMKARNGKDYYHLAAAADDDAVRTLQQRDFFKRYSEKTRLAGGGAVEVLPLEIVGETAPKA